MGWYFVAVLRPLFVLDPRVVVPIGALALPLGLTVAAVAASVLAAAHLVNALQPTELLRDE